MERSSGLAGSSFFSDEALDRLEKRFGVRGFEAAAKKRTDEPLGGHILTRSHYYMSHLAVRAMVAIGLQHQDRDARIAALDDLLLKRVGQTRTRASGRAWQGWHAR